jgi:outer membrane murein-binding lipoprotein Lpp
LQKEAPLAKGLTTAKSAIFGVPSLETARAIDDVDKIDAINSAHYRLQARMHQLEAEFEAKARELRAAFLTEIAEITGEEGN